MSIFKIVMMIIFIVIGLLYIINNPNLINFNHINGFKNVFPNGLSGFLRSMLIVIFTYGGIATVAMAASEVKNPHKEIPKATVMMTIGIVLLYIVSMLIIILVLDWSSVNTLVSPFVQVFDKMNYRFGEDFINATILIATLSVMIGAYYGSLQMLVSLSSAKEADKSLSVRNSKGFYFNAWIITGMSVFLVVLLSFVLGTKLFNYLISAATYFAFFNWIINLWTYIVWYKKRDESEKYLSPLIKGPIMAIITIILIFILIIFSLSVFDFRIGFYSAIAISMFVGIYYKIIRGKI
jgi:L-asparagine transporter-like permease